MTAYCRQRGQTLILIATWLLLGGGAASALVVYDRPVSEMKKAVKHIALDDGRKDAMLADIDRWESSQEKLDEAVSDGREQLLKLMRRKETRFSDLEPIIAGLDEKFLAMDQAFLDERFRLKDRVTSAEWAQLVARPPPDR
jgi:hypothetical protein